MMAAQRISQRPASRFLALSAAAALMSMLTTPASGQLRPPEGPSFGGSVPDSQTVVPGIAWYGVLQDGLAEAERTGKPILFITAAAQCGGIPGMW